MASPDSMIIDGGKTVSFKPTITIVKFHDDSSSESRWYTVAERKRLICEARDQSKAWLNTGYNFLLKNTYKDPCHDAQNKLDAYSQLDGGDYCRGLERHVCKQHGALRDAFKKGAVKAVVARQKRLREAGASPEEMSQNLAEYTARITSPAAVFAQRLGNADEMVVRQGEDASKVRQIFANESGTSLKLQDSQASMRDCSDRSVMAVNGWYQPPAATSCS